MCEQVYISVEMCVCVCVCLDACAHILLCTCGHTFGEASANAHILHAQRMHTAVTHCNAITAMLELQ